MTMAAALAAMAVSLMSRSALSSWLSSSSQALLLQGAEELLDDPALLVPGDDAPGDGRVGDRVGGQQPPEDRLGALGRIDLGHLDQDAAPALRQALLQRLVLDAAARPGRSGAEQWPRALAGLVDARAAPRSPPARRRPARGGQLAAAPDACGRRMARVSKWKPSPGTTRPLGVDVRLAVADLGDHGGLGQTALAACAVVSQRSNSFVGQRRSACGIVTRPSPRPASGP